MYVLCSIMLALCFLSSPYYDENYAGIIDAGLTHYLYNLAITIYM